MKYKKWWMPAVFMLISAAFLGIGYAVSLALTEDNSMTNHIYYLIGMGIWFFLAVPVLSFIYPRKVLAKDRERFLLTLYNSVMLILPMACMIFIFEFSKELLIGLVLFFIWAEMWAMLGLAGKGDKKADVWYVPLFIGFAVIVVNAYLSAFFDGYLHAAIISCIACPIAVVFYTRICVRDRKSKVFYSVYVSLAMLISNFSNIVYPIIDGTVTLESPVWDTVCLVLAAIVSFAIYLVVALLGAGIKIKLPKRKKKKADAEESGEAASR